MSGVLRGIIVCDVPKCTPPRNPSCGLTHRKKPSYMNWKNELIIYVLLVVNGRHYSLRVSFENMMGNK